MSISRGVFFIFGLLCATLSVAHHSFAMFDRSQQITLQGTVKDYQWTNPHVFVQFLVRNDKGEDQEWSIEGASPNMLYREGWTKTTFQAGDQLTLVVNPLKDGSHGGYFLFCRFADGKTLGSVGGQKAPG
jgi:hypothetical protein